MADHHSNPARRFYGFRTDVTGAIFLNVVNDGKQQEITVLCTAHIHDANIFSLFGKQSFFVTAITVHDQDEIIKGRMIEVVHQRIGSYF